MDKMYGYFGDSSLGEKDVAKHFFAKISKLMPFMLHITDADSRKLLYINDKIEELLGYSSSDLHKNGGEHVHLIHRDDLEPLTECIKSLFRKEADEDAVKASYRIRHRNGSWAYIESTFSVFEKKENGQVKSIIGISEVITTRKLVEIENKRYENMTRIAEESFLYGAWEYDLESNEVNWSKGVYDLFGIEKNSENAVFSLEKYISLVPEEERSEVLNIITSHIAEGKAYTIQHSINMPSGEFRYIRGKGRPVLNSEGKPIRYIGSVWDFTDQYNTQKQLEINQKKLRDAELELRLGTCEWDILNDREKWSIGMWKIFEYETDEVRNGWFSEDLYLSHVKEEQREEAEQIFSSYLDIKEGDSKGRSSEFTITTQSGNVRFIRTTMRVVEWKNGRPSMAIGSTIDITEMKKAQHALEDKVEELNSAYQDAEQFAYVASHDLKEPLRKIITFGERLQATIGENLDARPKLYLEKVVDGAQRMNVLINNLLKLSRTKRKESDFIDYDLNEALEEALQNLEYKLEETEAQIEKADLPSIEAIPHQIVQLFQNIIGNALKFTKEGEKPIVALTKTALNNKEKIDKGLDLFTDYTYITIKDNGIGFEQEYAAQIFSPFKRLHGRSAYEGTGIGLAICKKVVQNHNGKIWATGEPGKGALFHLILPVKQPVVNTENL